MIKFKKQIYATYPKHSAYRSGYKSRGGTYVGTTNSKTSLATWYKETWLNQRREVGYKNKSDVCRPTVRVNKDTPTTYSESTKEQIEKQRQRN